MPSQSMPRYAAMLAEGMKERNHVVEVWAPEKNCNTLALPHTMKKYLGYVDQFIIFPWKTRKRLKKIQQQVLFVFADQTLSPWLPMVVQRPHVLHCHDFLAQRSALGEIPEKKTGFLGKIYQAWIRKEYRKGKNFISISKKTQSDLHSFLPTSPKISEVIYNGLNQDFKPGNANKSRRQFADKFGLNLENGFVLHVGGNQFYKNRIGVVRIYEAWRSKTTMKLHLVMIGPEPTVKMKDAKETSHFSSDIHYLSHVSDKYLKLAYKAAKCFLFPSLDEGFGWPIAEAMACGCPVITTDRAPMNEVGGKSCFYIPRMPENKISTEKWAYESANVLNKVVSMGEKDRENLVAAGIKNATRFDTKRTLSDIELVYQRVLKNYQE